MRDSGFGMGRTYGTGLARESGVPDALRMRGDCGVDVSTPRPGVAPSAAAGTVLPDIGNAVVVIITPESAVGPPWRGLVADCTGK